MSRISAVRSNTLTRSLSSRFRSWPGDSSSSMITASARVAWTSSCISASFPLPTNVAGSAPPVRRATPPPTGRGPAPPGSLAPEQRVATWPRAVIRSRSDRASSEGPPQKQRTPARFPGSAPFPGIGSPASLLGAFIPGSIPHKHPIPNFRGPPLSDCVTSRLHPSRSRIRAIASSSRPSGTVSEIRTNPSPFEP